jgi:hypothetical protein
MANASPHIHEGRRLERLAFFDPCHGLTIICPRLLPFVDAASERRRKAKVDMIPVSDALKELLCRHGMSAGSLAGDDAQGMDAGMLEGTAHPLADAAHREEPRIRSGMGKGAPAETGASEQGGNVRFERSRGPILEVHVNPNMSGMPMRQTTQTPRAVAPRGVVSLMVIDGGLA